MKHVIWTNDLDYKDWKADLESYYPDEEGYNEDERIRIMHEVNNDYLGDEIITLDKKTNPIVQFGDLGLWNGRLGAYRIAGNNLNCIFKNVCGDIVTWMIDDKEVVCKDVHHDGVNYYTYRELKDGVSQFEFEETLFETIDAAMEMTQPIGHYVAEIYGIEVEE